MGCRDPRLISQGQTFARPGRFRLAQPIETMTNLTLQHPGTGIIKQAPVGFSWTTLCFGPLPALFRGDFKWFFVQLFAGGILLIPVLIFPFIYNKIHLKKLLEAGYKVKSVEGTTIEILNRRLGLELPLLPGP